MQPVGQYARVYTATDVCGNLETFIQFITLVDEEAPQFSSFPGDVTAECGEEEFPMPVAFDNCTAAEDIVLVEEREEVPGSCPGAYSIVRTFTATDDCGNATTQVQTITVVDTTAPSWSSSLKMCPSIAATASVGRRCSHRRMQRPGRHPLRLTPWQAHVPKRTRWSGHSLPRTNAATPHPVNHRSGVHRQHGTCVCGSAARGQHHDRVRRGSRSGHVDRHGRLSERGRAIHRDLDPRLLRQRIHPPSRMGGCRRLWQ